MTRNQFVELCSDYFISPEIAIENISIADALANRDDERVKYLLEIEF